MSQMDGQTPEHTLAEARAQARAQARGHIEILRQSGLSREDILALLDEPLPRVEEQSLSQPRHQGQLQQHEDQSHDLSGDQSQPLSSSSTSFAFPLPPQSQTHDAEDPLNPQPIAAEHAVQPTQQPPGPRRTLGQNDIKVPPHFRHSAASTISSCSSHDSVFTSASARSSVSLTAGSSDNKFWCTSCDKTFKRKFDWKRHEEEFHERWRKYPCPNCNQSFWGPNTFNQHHKSAHGCKSCPHSDVVVKYMKRRKAWGCGFCAAMHMKFEKHIDHVAAHFEGGCTKSDWLHSNVIYGLLHQHGIHEAWKDQVASNSDAFNGHHPMFSWQPASTGRASGYVEGDNPAQLQDFLEFYDGTEEAAAKIIQGAWSCAEIVLRQDGTVLTGIVKQGGARAVGNSHKHIPITSLQPHSLKLHPRRGPSNSAVSAAKRAVKRSTSHEEFTAHHNVMQPSGGVPSVVVSPPMQQQVFSQPQGQLSPHAQQLPHQGPYAQAMNPTYPNLFSTAQDHNRMMSLDKALPPEPPMPNMSPLASTSAPSLCATEFPRLFDDPEQPNLMMPNPEFTDEWPDTSTAHPIMEDYTMGGTEHPTAMFAPTGYPMGWNGMGNFSTDR